MQEPKLVISIPKEVPKEVPKKVCPGKNCCCKIKPL